MRELGTQTPSYRTWFVCKNGGSTKRIHRHVCFCQPTQVQSLLLRVASVSPHLLIHYAAAAVNSGQTSADGTHNSDAMDHVKQSLQQQHSRLLKDTEIVFRELTKMTEVRGATINCG